jgi:hypothetical protein
MNDNSDEYQSGAALFAGFGLVTREQKLEQAVRALLETVDELHVECKDQSLADNLTNEEVFCSCADAYRMGHEALK